MNKNEKILAKELELIFYDPEINPIHRNWLGIAKILLSKLSIDRDRVEKIIEESDPDYKEDGRLLLDTKTQTNNFIDAICKTGGEDES